MQTLPQTGLSKDDILGTLEGYRADDVRWQDGRTFGMVYDAGPEAHDVVEAVAQRFLHDNALNTRAFPSLAKIQSEVVGITADLLHGPQAADVDLQRPPLHPLHSPHPRAPLAARARPARCRM